VYAISLGRHQYATQTRSFAAEIRNRGATCAAFVVEARTGEAVDIGAMNPKNTNYRKTKAA